MFFSRDNNCSTFSDTKNLNYLMAFILVMGYITILAYLYIIVSLPFQYFSDRSAQFQAKYESKAKMETLLKSLSRIQYQDCNVIDDERTCAICLQEYKDDDVITQLACNSKHFFHNYCLQSSIINGNY